MVKTKPFKAQVKVIFHRQSVEKSFVLTPFEEENRALVFGAYKKNFIGYFVACLIHNVRITLHLIDRP